MKKLFLDRLAAYLFGGQVWGRLQAIVHIVEEPNLTGAEKRAAALVEIQRLGLGLAGFMLNLGLEMAVAKIKM